MLFYDRVHCLECTDRPQKACWQGPWIPPLPPCHLYDLYCSETQHYAQNVPGRDILAGEPEAVSVINPDIPLPSEAVAQGQMGIDGDVASDRRDVPQDSAHVDREVHAVAVPQLESHAYARQDIARVRAVSVYDVAALAQKEELRPRPVHEIVLGLQPHGESEAPRNKSALLNRTPCVVIKPHPGFCQSPKPGEGYEMYADT